MASSPAEKKNAQQLLDILTTGASGRNRLLPADMLELVIERVGGKLAFARILGDMLTDSRTPGVAKQRIISDLMRTMQHVETKSKPPPDLSTFATEDLKTQLRQALELLEGDGGKEAPGAG